MTAMACLRLASSFRRLSSLRACEEGEEETGATNEGWQDESEEEERWTHRWSRADTLPAFSEKHAQSPHDTQEPV